MSTDDRDGEVLPFPRVTLPPSFDAGNRPRLPVPAPAPAPDREPTSGPPMGAWPALPDVSTMGPPLHLTVPGTPVPEEEDQEEGFVPPPLQDPDNPRLRDGATMGLAVLAAVGVAAAHGAWHMAQGVRARVEHRQAVADQARTAADKQAAKGRIQPSPAFGQTAKQQGAGRSGTGGGSGGGSGRSGSAGGKVPETFRSNSPRKGPERSSSAVGPHAGGKVGSGPQKGAGGGGGTGSDRKGKDRGKDGGRDRGGRSGDSASARERAQGRRERRAARQGAKLADRDQARERRQTEWTDRRADKADRKGRQQAGKVEKADRKKAERDAKRAKTAAEDRVTLGQALANGAQRRWEKRSPTAVVPKKVNLAKKPKKPPRPPAPAGSGPGPAGPGSTGPKVHSKRSKAKRTPRPAASTPGPSGPGAGPGPTPGAPGSGPGPSAGPGTGFTGPPGFTGMKPPPGAAEPMRVWLERVDPSEQPVPAPAGALGSATAPAALPAGSSTPQPPAAAVPPQRGARFVSAPVKSTQYKDAELTVYDVIDADADMAEQITEGVDEAQAAADGCDQLMTKLEALHAKVVDLKVPGSLEGAVVRLMEFADRVKAKAEAIAAALPRASEAISTAGTNAEWRHRHPADVTRDMGHTRPAERDYHND